MRVHRLGIGAALVAVACGAAPKAPAPPAAAVQSVSGPRVTMPSGAVYRLEMARTPEEQQMGLMFRENLPENAGMVFLFNDGGVHQFWMKNTMIPLDMLWLDSDGRVLFISADTPPCKADPCQSYGPATPAATVLEIAGGLAKREKIEPGSTLRFQDIP